ncbi:hypothetical protein, partial [Mesorhizobium sp.]|uniref:hypothetical protein n=1 Tax=Mesorhizobium sp. TaxID=1871066 RepID=UPI00338EE5AD
SLSGEIEAGLVVQRLDDKGYGNQIIGRDSALAVLHDGCDLLKGLQFTFGNPGAAHPLIEVGHAHSQRLGRSNLTVRHDDQIPPLMASRRTFRHGGLSSQSLWSFDDFDDLACARVNDNGSVVDDNGAVF